MWAIVTGLLGTLVGVWAFIKYLLLLELRIDSATFKSLYDFCKDKKRFQISEEIVESKYPEIFVAIFFISKVPFFYLYRDERLLTAGFQGKDSICRIVFCRFRYRQMKKFLLETIRENNLNQGVPVEVLSPYGSDRIGMLKGPLMEPVIENWQDIDKEVGEVARGSRNKTGILLFGPPGNSKTYFVKYLACKHNLPIKIINFNPDLTNTDIMMTFAKIPSKCIVLLDDFDSVFHNRNCVIGSGNNSIKFSFDAILNSLDGVFNNYESVVFILTANDLNKVDCALKNRPSRFKYVRLFDNPSLEIRKKLLPQGWAEASKGRNLDQVFRLKEYYELGDFEAIRQMSTDSKQVFNRLEGSHTIINTNN